MFVRHSAIKVNKLICETNITKNEKTNVKDTRFRTIVQLCKDTKGTVESYHSNNVFVDVLKSK